MTDEEFQKLLSDFVSEVEWYGHCIGEGNLSDAVEAGNLIDSMFPSLQHELFNRATR